MLGGQRRIHIFNTVFIIKSLVLDKQIYTLMKVSNRKKEIMRAICYITPSHREKCNLFTPEDRISKTNSSSS